MSGKLSEQVAIVTGSSSGNGRAIALALYGAGAAIVCADLHKNAASGGYEEDLSTDTDDLIRSSGGRADFVSVDVRKAAEVEALVAKAVSDFGRLDIMVNNAGVFTGLHTILDETEEQYDFTMAVNGKGVWLGCKYAIRQMMRQQPIATGSRGKIINIASIGGLVGLAEEPAYCASKGMVVNLTRQLAIDFAQHRINVNAICPGYLATAMVRPFLDNPETNKLIHEATPWPRVGKAEDVANCALFLASGDSEWISGSMITVDGAFTAR